MFRTVGLLLAFAAFVSAADLVGSKDPPGMKRYEGSVIIGYREPKFDEYVGTSQRSRRTQSAEVHEESPGGGPDQPLYLHRTRRTHSHRTAAQLQARVP